MEKQISDLIKYLDKTLMEKQQELLLDPTNEYLKGTIAGLQYSIRSSRILFINLDGRQSIDIIID